MPHKNTIKIYLPDTYYHVYNRGLLKGRIFQSNEDYWKFRTIIRKKIYQMNKMIKISEFSLVPNHFHFLLWQKNERDIEHFMRSIMTSYGMHYSKKYNTEGRLFGSSYKAERILDKKHLSQIKQYILTNAARSGFDDWKHEGKKP